MVEIKTVEAAAFYMSASLAKLGFGVEATSAPSPTGGSTDGYRKYIALTQRILKDGALVCYLTYRCTQTTRYLHPQFSSYQLLDSSYNEIVGAKWHLRDSATPEDCFKTVYEFIRDTFK